MALLLAVGLGVVLLKPGAAPTPHSAEAVARIRVDRASVPAATYVGGAACTSCHAKEHAAWKGSHHERAMAAADEASVLGRFEPTTFRHAGVTSTFFKRDGRFFVNTDGPGGKLADFEIKYTFGVSPLQQYLVALPGGRLQALGVAWDARPTAQGGQRWFHLYPGQALKPGDLLHWTGLDQVWNHQCADCHSTNLRKNYDQATNGYATTWTDISVNCEACHGPGSNHLAWAKRDAGGRRSDIAGKGLAVALDERRGVSWAIDAQSGNAARSTPRDGAREIETCARCHSRRAQFTDAWQAGDRLADGFGTSLIEPGLYYDDGQMREEVFNHGSFLGSKMHARGVTCSDCHDPHTQKLRLPGNAVCSQCHAPARYEKASHHHHVPGSKGAECAACHMPTTTYMVVDARHDHSFRIPRPDRTLSLGVPNACNGCHTDREPQWAADALKAWYPQPKAGFQTFAEAFAAKGRGMADVLAGIAQDREQSGLVRASAIARLGRTPSPATLRSLRDALADPDAVVRAAAVEALSDASVSVRAQLLPGLLGDPVRQVRMEAARGLVGEPASLLAPAAQEALAKALDEYIAAQRFNADRPEGRANLGNVHAAQGRYEDALEAYRGALALDPRFVQAALNLADLQRTRGAEGDAEKTLREALARDPRSASVHHALGLSLTRQGRSDAALKAFAQAVALGPDDPRFVYVYAVALNEAGRRAQALHQLEAAVTRWPEDPDLLMALALLERDSGNRASALGHAQRLLALEPENANAQRLVGQLAPSR